MAYPTTKQELLSAITDGYAQLNEQIAKMSEAEQTAPFTFVSDPKKCGVRWQNDRCLRDLLVHIHEWQVLMRIFVQNIRDGHPKDYLPEEYRKNYLEMEKALLEKHQSTTLAEARNLLRQTHDEMYRLAESFSEEDLFTKGFYKSTYTTNMSAYFLSVVPYGQAVKILKMHQKSCKKG
ncbi:MAG: ClbS/DfsB family four-helix bundle protein [Bacteroidales bacterium]|nr:ClbS/DfsB family four-helix bundle protein [Bacteroidales bacterium]